MAQVIKKYRPIYLLGAKSNENRTIPFTFITFQMYSSSLIFQQNELKNHSNDMNRHKNVKGDQT